MIFYETAGISKHRPPAVVVDQLVVGREETDRENQGSCKKNRLSILSKALRNSGHRELKEIQIGLEGNTVTLRGTVSTFYRKQVAQEAIRRHASGLRIVNQLKVKSDWRK